MAVTPLKENYGDKVAVDYREAGASEEAKKKIEEFNRAKGYAVPLPFVTVNGRMTLEGWVSYYDLASHVDEILAGQQ
ncbi:MAG: hypothetical protein M1548_06840 [Actinobacteria bacterium]|nr:hypothetical protein [Chloroflexota bacterium]MCL5292227.1 hypothetical protein [Actinomycetota bacterium]